MTSREASRLRQFELFASCDDRDLEGLVRSGDATSVPAGWALIREDTPGDVCYVILDGTVEVHQHDERVATLGPGDVVGEVALTGGGLRNATVVAQTPLELLHIDAPQFRKLLDERPGLRAAISAYSQARK